MAKIFVASDHAGFELKEKIKVFLENKGHDVKDVGAHSFEPKDDYPDFIIPAAQQVASTPGSKGIILGGSGQGEAITANKIKGIRAVVFYGGNKDIITLSRSHNDANILSLGARFLTEQEACDAIESWLAQEFSSDERHKRRIEKIELHNSHV